MKRVGVSLAALIAAAALFGCAPKGGGPAPSVGAAAGKTVIAVIPKGTNQSYWLAVKAGAEAAAAEAKDVTIEWNGPAEETDVDGQIRIVQNAVTRNVAAIVLAATNASSLARYVDQAQQKKIPVVTIDSGIAPDTSAAFLATDNVKGGQVGAEALAEAIGGKGKVGLLPFVQGAASSDERERGFREGIRKTPGLDLGDRVLYSNSDVAKALTVTRTMLSSTPDLAGIFAANQGGAEGAIQAIKQAGKVGKVRLVCYDASDAELQALRDGVVSALIVQNPYRMGYEGVKTALRAKAGEKIDPRKIDTGVTKVTKANLETPEIKKLLNPTAP